MISTSSELTEILILKNLLSEESYFSTVFQYVQKKDFEDISNSSIYNCIGELYKKYKKPPTINDLEIYVETKAMSINEKSLIREKLTELKNEEIKDINKELLIDSTEKWLKNRRFYEQVALESVKVIEGESKYTLEEIQKNAEEINKMTFKGSDGLDYIKDSEANFIEYQKLYKDGVKSGINIIDIATGGGFRAGQLFLLSAISNSGKTLFLVNIGANALLQKKNVAFFSFEEEEIEIRSRFDACLLDKKTEDFKTLGPTLKSSFDNLLKKGIGNLKIKSYGPRAGNCLTIKAQLEEWKLKENFKPDLIVLDSITIIAPVAKVEGMYSVGKAVSEEVKSLSNELKTPIVSAVQFGRQNFSSNNKPDMSGVAESIAISQISSSIVAITCNEHQPDTRTLTIIKSRNINKEKTSSEKVRIETDKQQVMDLMGEEKRIYIKQEEKKDIMFAQNVAKVTDEIDEENSESVLNSLFN